MTARTTIEIDFTVVHDRLSDGSHVWNVVGTSDGAEITIGAVSAQNARTIADALNNAAWIQVDREG